MSLQKVGALWKKDGKNGTFLSGEIELGKNKTHILVFKNEEKEGKQPDYRIMLAQDDEPRPFGKQDRFKEASDEDVPF